MTNSSKARHWIAKASDDGDGVDLIGFAGLMRTRVTFEEARKLASELVHATAKDPSRPSTVFDRVMRRTVRVGECLEFTGARSDGRYGAVNSNGRRLSTHRVVYAHHHGEIPSGMYIMHSCDNPACVEISHLRIGTPEENAADMVAKGRHRGGRRPKSP